MNIRDFADPAPASGLLVLDYNTYQMVEKIYGSDGEQVTQIHGLDGNPADLNSEVDGYFNTPMVLWVSKKKLFGATYFGGASIPIITANAKFGLFTHWDYR